MAETHQICLSMMATPQAPHPLEGTPQTLPSVQPQRAAPVEASHHEKPAGKQRKGRRKIPMKRIHDDNDRMVTFSKRRVGIYKKGTEISTLCGADIGILIFSPAGNPYAYGVPNIESIADRFLRGVNPEVQDHNVSRIVNEAQRRAHVGKLNSDCDELSVYLQNLKEQGDRLMQLKKQTFDRDCWWDIPVEDLNADEMQKMKMTMEEIKKNASKRLWDLRAGASSSSAVVQQEDIHEGFGYVGDGGFGDFMEAGSSSAVADLQGGVMQMGGNLGHGYRNSTGGSGGFGDSRAGGSTVAGIQDGRFQLDGNEGLGGFSRGVGGLGDWGVSSSAQAGGLQMGENEINGYGGRVGGGFVDFTAGGSEAASVQHGGMQVVEYERGGFGGGYVADGGIGQWRPVGSAAASSATQPGFGSMLMCGNGGGSYGWGNTGGGGLNGGWKPVNLSSTFSTIQVANPMQIAGIGGHGNFGGGVGGGLCDWGAVASASMHMGGNGEFGYNDGVIVASAGFGTGGGGLGDWRSIGSTMMQMGGHNNFGGSAGGGLGGWGAGGASSSSSLQPNPMQMGQNGGLNYGGVGGGAGSEFGDFTAGGSSLLALQPDQDRMAGTGDGGSSYN